MRDLRRSVHPSRVDRHERCTLLGEALIGTVLHTPGNIIHAIHAAYGFDAISLGSVRRAIRRQR
jgi:hypothetical protein